MDSQKIMTTWAKTSSCILSTALCFGTATAQPAIDAGQLLPQQPPPRAPERPDLGKVESPGQVRSEGGPTTVVRKFVLQGNTLMTDDALAPALVKFVGRPLNFQGLENAAQAVSQAYRGAGWVVNAFLPKQEIKDGVVTIQVVEAKFGGTRVASKNDVRTPPNRAVTLIEAQVPMHEPVQVKTVERALLLLNELPGLKASGNLIVGQRQGQSDLLLQLSDAPLLVGQFEVDNTSARSIGRERLSMQAQLSGWLGRGDKATLGFAVTPGSEYGEASVSAPLGWHGTRLGLKASKMRYKLVAPEFRSLDSQGESSNGGVELTHPMARQRDYGANFSSSLDLRSFANQSLGATLSDYRTESLTLGVNAYAFDNILGGGTSSLSLQLTGGRVDLSRSPNAAQDAATTKTQGRFARLRGALSRQQALTDNLSVNMSLAGQIASKNLDSSEKFYLGGSSGVRAYPSGEAGGSQGILAKLELQQRLSEAFSASGFFDWGQVMVLREGYQSSSSAAGPNRFSLKGLGATFTWQLDPQVQVSATWARRIGSNPNALPSTGADQDGTLDLDRIWARMQIAF